MDKKCTDTKGNYTLSGEASDPPFTKIDPTLKIYHSCNKPLLQICDTKLVYELPKANINGAVFDFGITSLDARQKDSETDCNHYGWPC